GPAAGSEGDVGGTTGTYAGGVLSTTSKMTVKLPSLKAFGIPLGGGEKCQTAEPSEIKLKSTESFFNPSKGGPLKASDYKISKLQDCGALTGILSLFTSGSGNTIDIVLTPKTQG
ncbi:hypothetical protein ABGB12_33630, partial [Actinocorallia sp. B10E7]